MPVATAYEQGPFSALQVAPPPAELLALARRATGLPLTAQHLVELQRLALFMGWTGPELGEPMLLRRWLQGEPLPAATDQVQHRNTAAADQAFDDLDFDDLGE
jgi:hypothetical protein